MEVLYRRIPTDEISLNINDNVEIVGKIKAIDNANNTITLIIDQNNGIDIINCPSNVINNLKNNYLIEAKGRINQQGQLVYNNHTLLPDENFDVETFNKVLKLLYKLN